MEALQINRPLVARLKEQMVRKGMNPKTLAERANVGRSFVYDILNGKSTNPTSVKLASIADELNVSVQYLLTGVNPSLRGQGSMSELVELLTVSVEETRAGNIVVTNNNKNASCMFSQDWISHNFNLKPQDLRIFKVKGDAMEPSFYNNDTVLVNVKKKLPNPPGLFLVFDGVGLSVKRLETIGGNKINVVADNKKYSSFTSDMEELEVIGEVVWFAREL